MERQPAYERVRWYVIVIGLILLIVNTYWIFMGSEVWHSTQLTIASLFFNAVFTLLILILLNFVFQRFIPRYALTQADLLMIYTMIVMLSTISGHPMMGYLLPAIEHPFWFATEENEWVQLFGNQLPTWLVVHDRDVLKGYFEGDSTLYTPSHLSSWLMPVLSWSAFIVALWLLLMFASIMLRKQWMENEKLSYPIVQLPIAMTTEPKKFFTSKLMWIGFSISAAIEIWNGFAFIYPAIPMLHVKDYAVGSFSSRPWNAMGSINTSFYPFVIGIMFFTPLDLSFSCWFFYIIGKLQMVFGSAVGMRSVYPYEQSLGAWVALGIISIWMGRKFFWQIIRRIIGAKSLADDSSEPVRYRSAALGMLIGLLFLGFFCYQMGMSWWVILLYPLIYFPMVLGITRARAEIGPPVHTLIYIDPGRVLVSIFGTRSLGNRTLTAFTLLYPFNRCYRANPMPSELEAFRIADRVRIDSRKLMIGMIIAIVLGVIVTFWVYLHVLYQMGAANKARGWLVYMGWETYNRLQSWLTDQRMPDYVEVSGMAGGFIFTVLLMFMKTRFIWFPFHPAGYVLAVAEGLGYFWFAVFVSWAIKSVIMRFGGAKSFRKAAPIFLGLILGDYTLGCLWSIIGIVLQMPTYGVWH